MAVDEVYPEFLFSYGTLQLEAVQMATFGRRLAGASDALRGFEVVLLEIEDQTVVAISGTAHHTMAKFTGRASDVVTGTVFAVTPDEIQNADRYEVAAVKRVAVVLQSGVRAWAYVDARQSGMQLPNRIHIVGASGSGTTSLASAIADQHGHRHLDTDDFFWVPTNPPFREKRPRDQRLALLRQALVGSGPWVLSGSLCGWGDPLIREFDLVVFLVIPTSIRLARLRAREVARYGHQAIAAGGELHQPHVEFLEWAGRYDTGGLEMRSRALHEAWVAALPGPVLRLEGDRSVGDQITQIEASMAAAGVSPG